MQYHSVAMASALSSNLLLFIKGKPAYFPYPDIIQSMLTVVCDLNIFLSVSDIGRLAGQIAAQQHGGYYLQKMSQPTSMWTC